MSRKRDSAQFSLFAAEALSESTPRDEGTKTPQGDDKPARGLSRTTKRLIATSAEIALGDPEQLAFQHTVLCQTAMPYHNQGRRRHWQRKNGFVTLEMEAGRALDPRTGEFGPVGLPFGARARLVLMHLNSQAMRTGKPEIEIEDSLTAFVREVLSRQPRGRDITTIRDQVTALAAATVRLGMTDGTRAVQVHASVVDAFDLWAPDNPEQKILWPSTVRLGERYFRSLVDHAVPLDQRAIAALAHSALGLDLYSWLAQRLHRIPPGQEDFIAWPLLHQQFGAGYTRLRDFRAFFLQQLRAVQTQYPAARLEADGKGLRLRHSPPPVGGHITGPGTVLE